MLDRSEMAAKTPDLKIDYMNRFPSRELEEIESECQSLLSRSIGDWQAPAHHIS